MAKTRKDIKKWCEKNCPWIQEKIERNKSESRCCMAIYNSERKYEVACKGQSYKVSIVSCATMNVI